MAGYRDLTIQDFLNRNARDFIRDRILESDAGLTPGAYDEFGTNLETTADISAILLFLYRFYFRAELHGVENLPPDGAGLIVSNHAPILPFDAAMIFISALVEPERPRFIRTIINRSIASIPFGSYAIARCGQIIGCDENVRRIFERENLIVVFPTGAEGDIHTIFNKYHVDKFTVGFMEYALKHRTPIIPTIVTGSEEAAMTLGKIDTPLFGFKHLPITPVFPWLGLLGLIPFPSKFDIRIGPPVDYFTEHAADADSPEIVRELVENLRSIIINMLGEALGK